MVEIKPCDVCGDRRVRVVRSRARQFELGNYEAQVYEDGKRVCLEPECPSNTGEIGMGEAV